LKKNLQSCDKLSQDFLGRAAGTVSFSRAGKQPEEGSAATTSHLSGIALYLVNCAAAPTCHDVDGSDLSQPIEELI
jgi:hypothetical protein